MAQVTKKTETQEVYNLTLSEEEAKHLMGVLSSYCFTDEESLQSSMDIELFDELQEIMGLSAREIEKLGQEFCKQTEWADE